MEAYLKKLCFEYQVDEKEVKELLARMEMVYLDKGETIASATMPEQRSINLYFHSLISQLDGMEVRDDWSWHYWDIRFLYDACLYA